jgi:hypothetical protein
VEVAVVGEVMDITQLPVNLAGQAVVLMAVVVVAELLHNLHNHKQLGQPEVILIMETTAGVGPVAVEQVLAMLVQLLRAERADLVVLLGLVQVTLEVEALLKELVLVAEDVGVRLVKEATLE